MEDLLDRQVDGLIVIPCHRHQSESTLLRASRQTNVVQLDREASPHVHFVGMDHALAMRMLLEHLYSTGRKRFAYLGRTRPVRLLTNARAHTCDTSRGPPTPLAYCLVTSPSTGGWRGHCG